MSKTESEIASVSTETDNGFHLRIWLMPATNSLEKRLILKKWSEWKKSNKKKIVEKYTNNESTIPFQL